MSDINLDFTVSNNSIDFTVQPNDITITPTDVQLTFNANFQPLAGGSPFQLQFNNTGVLGGVANSSYTSGNLTLGDVANIKITGGTNGYVLQTDGAGNLDWAAQTGGGGNGSPGGSNTQIQYNDNGLFGGNVGFTFNEVSGNVAIPGNLSVAGNIVGNALTANYAAYAGNVTIGAQPNITSVGTLTNLSVAGNAIVANLLISGTTTINAGIEQILIDNSAPNATINFNLIDQSITYNTANATNNITLNFRANSTISANTYLNVNDSIIGTYVVSVGATTYSVSNVQIDGVTQTIKWLNGSTPPVIANSLMAYTFTMIKTATTPTYVVLGSGTRYS
jgi:hypothetical protein